MITLAFWVYFKLTEKLSERRIKDKVDLNIYIEPEKTSEISESLGNDSMVVVANPVV